MASTCSSNKVPRIFSAIFFMSESDDTLRDSPRLWDKHLQSISGEISVSELEGDSDQVTRILPLEETSNSSLLAISAVPGSCGTSDNALQDDLTYLIDHYKPTMLVCLAQVEKLEQNGLASLLDQVRGCHGTQVLFNTFWCSFQIPMLRDQHSIQVLLFPLAENCFTSLSDIETLKILTSEVCLNNM